MPTDLYAKLSDLNLLRRAWHLSRDDSRGDFMFDPYRHSDFGFRLDDHLKALSQSLANGSYHPQPLLTIDVPKSTLAVRPGTVMAIEDRIVLFAVACLIAPLLDRKLPDAVYSCRVKKDAKNRELFHQHELLQFPFLKGKTIRRELDFIEPWYGQWPQFAEDLVYAYEEEKYGYLVVSDIVSYFENLDLTLLRDLLLHHLPRQPRIINFVIGLLEYWAWPACFGPVAPRGIPQGNAISGFLANFYLLPLDEAFKRFSRAHATKYFRYVDDVKVFAKDMASARDALFLMNRELRSLRLNIQGAKTRILQGAEIRAELFDDRLEAVNAIIVNIQKQKPMTKQDRDKCIEEIHNYHGKVRGRRGILRGGELRLFRRLITAYTLLSDSSMVGSVLDQLQRNPDQRLLNSAVKYLRNQDRNRNAIADRLVALLQNADSLFPFQEAYFLMALRYLRHVPPNAIDEARKRIKNKQLHWYVRQQAITLLCMKKLGPAELRWCRNEYVEDDNVEVKRAWIQTLAQLPSAELEELAQELLFAIEPRLQRLGRLYHGLLFDEKRGLDQLTSVFQNWAEQILIDRLYEVEVLAKARSEKVRTELRNQLRNVLAELRRPALKDRILAIIAMLPAVTSRTAQPT